MSALVAAEAGARARTKNASPAKRVVSMPRKPRRPEAEIAADREAYERQLNEDRVTKLLDECGVPIGLRKSEQLDETTIPAHARRIWGAAKRMTADHVGRQSIIGLIGVQGTGKSTLATSLVLAECRAGRLARYVSAREYLELANRTRNFNSKVGIAAVEEKFCRAPLLVIDELQLQESTEFNTLSLRALVLRRWDYEVSTVLVSNDLPDMFEQRIGREITSRMLQSGATFAFDYEDLRHAGRRERGR